MQKPHQIPINKASPADQKRSFLSRVIFAFFKFFLEMLGILMPQGFEDGSSSPYKTADFAGLKTTVFDLIG